MYKTIAPVISDWELTASQQGIVVESPMRAKQDNLDEAPSFDTADARWRAVIERDVRAGDAFVYAVTTTGVACRPGCGSRPPRRENVRFFADLAEAVRAGFRPCKRCHAGGTASAGAKLLARACRLLEQEDGPARSEQIARTLGMTPAQFARTFRAKLGVTPQQYRRRVLANRARGALGRANSVTEALYAAGYSSSSRFYAGAARELGMPPGHARRGGAGHAVHYAVRPTSLGPLLVAWTERGVSDVAFLDNAREAGAHIAARWPAARRAQGEPPRWLDSVVDAVERPRTLDVPLDIQGTAFQERVWQALREIPLGETRGYAELAATLGMPNATRAVASAIAKNQIALLVPCHRVIGKNGSLSGYRWGQQRKRELLRREGARSEK